MVVVFLAFFSTTVMISFYVKNRSLFNELNTTKVPKEALGEKNYWLKMFLPKENIKASQACVAMVQKAGSSAEEEEKKKIVENKILVENTAITKWRVVRVLKFDIVKGKDIDGKRITGSVGVVGKRGVK